MSPLARLAAAPIRFYRRWLSPLKPPTCRFHPTCSAYALEALERHGLARGFGLCVWRLLRCQPFCRGGFDPVPERAAWLPWRSEPGRGSPGSTRLPADPACDRPGEVDTVAPSRESEPL